MLLVGRASVLSARTTSCPSVRPDLISIVLAPVAPSTTWVTLATWSALSSRTVPLVSVVLVTADTGSTMVFFADATVIETEAVTPGASAALGLGTVTVTG